MTQDLPKNTKYKFLTLNHINSLLSNLNNNKQYINDELKDVLEKIYPIKLFSKSDWYSNLDHSIGVVKALPQLVLYSKDLEMLNKVDNFEKIKN